MNEILKWFGHSCFRYETSKESILFDPVRKNSLLGTTLDPQDEKNVSAIFVSHEHWDHNDPKTILDICSSRTKIYCPQTVILSITHEMSFQVNNITELKKLTERIVPVKIDDTVNLQGVEVRCLGASEGVSYLVFHKKKILFMGDSLSTKEMIKERPDVVLFPVWAVKGEEANLNDFLELAGNGLCIPMHYHSNKESLPNFYIDEKELDGLLPGNIDMKILDKNTVFEI
jgi:L-ascorbate metabolism protein UlaG (beta-lactamase superfamily)